MSGLASPDCGPSNIDGAGRIGEDSIPSHVGTGQEFQIAAREGSIGNVFRRNVNIGPYLLSTMRSSLVVRTQSTHEIVLFECRFVATRCETAHRAQY